MILISFSEIASQFVLKAVKSGSAEIVVSNSRNYLLSAFFVSSLIPM